MLACCGELCRDVCSRSSIRNALSFGNEKKERDRVDRYFSQVNERNANAQHSTIRRGFLKPPGIKMVKNYSNIAFLFYLIKISFLQIRVPCIVNRR